MRRVFFIGYAVFAYVLFLAVYALLCAFVGGFDPAAIPAVGGLLPDPRAVPEGAPAIALAVAVDLGLVALFGLQHTVMARAGFKAWFTRFVPAPIERATYLIASSAALLVLIALWRPLGFVVWEVAAPAGRAILWTLFALGWLGVPLVSFALDHFELFGLRQAFRREDGGPAPAPALRTPGPYRFVRHPLYVAWLLAFFAAPTMTAGHLLFAVAQLAYILIALVFEERDLEAIHGDEYREYRKDVGGLVPRLRRRARVAATSIEIV